MLNQGPNAVNHLLDALGEEMKINIAKHLLDALGEEMKINAAKHLQDALGEEVKINAAKHLQDALGVEVKINAARHLLDVLREEIKTEEVLSNHQPIQITCKDCHICSQLLNGDSIRDHCHITGRYRGATNNVGNLKLGINPTTPTPVVFHNLWEFDGHLMMQAIS